VLVQPPQTVHPVAGYELRERIGAGGYGEVWKAEAPGGLIKAIKFVYGYLDEVRAAGELKALNRIKGVRHPFLLSLERIEIVDGQLAIVTELADGCLKDRYGACRKEGLVGIPRDELLVYLGDAADALDYMNGMHSLQHLDVKPENLLLVGGRVKVGDFGLVKDIHDHTMSLMGGLTPVYAPPEVFDGKPSHFSDQYSLAIVYQELLTGTLPFPGKTAAQLAAQHLNGKPRLATLPDADQPAIARALLKDPHERFRTCREMVDRLIEASRSRTRQRDAPPPAPAEAAASAKAPAALATNLPTCLKATENVAGSGAETPPRRSSTHVELIGPPTPVVVSDLSPLELKPEEIALRPTLLVGLGGLAGTVLRSLRRRLFGRFGGVAQLPALQMLLLDTDRKALFQATQGSQAAAFDPRDTLALPLRRTQDYRRDTDRFLRWLSRRWLYNIPRSLETEGLRPLGRLALVDHAQDVRRRLWQALAEVATPEAAEAMAHSVGCPVQHASPRVILVSSLIGGAGSGMVIDIAYAARVALRELGFSDDAVTGLLLHATPRKTNARELAVINTYCCLNELYHFSRSPQGYPGDSACGLPPSEAPPFHDAYLLHLGDDLSDDDLHKAAEGVAEYLYRDTVTPAGAALEKCRNHARGAGASRTSVRTLGICRVGCAGTDLADAAAELLCRAVIDRWGGEGGTLSRHRLLCQAAPFGGRGSEPRSPMLLSRDVAQLATQCAEALEIQLQPLANRVDEFVDATLSKSAKAHLANLVQQYLVRRQLQRATEDGASPPGEFVITLDRLLGPRLADDPQSPSPTTASESAVGRAVDALSEKRGAAVRDWLFELADMPTGGVQAAQCAADWFAQHLKSLEKEVRESAHELRQQLARYELPWAAHVANGGRGALGRGRKADADGEEQLLAYALLRGKDFSLRCLFRLLSGLSRQIGAAGDELRQLRRELSVLADQFPPPPGIPDAGSGKLESVLRCVAEELEAMLDGLAGELSKDVLRELCGEALGLRSFLQQPELRTALPAVLRRHARRIVQQALSEIDVGRLLLEPSQDDSPSRLKECLDAAEPALLAECGGARRLLVFLPRGSDEKDLQAALHNDFPVAPMMAADDDGDVVFVVEAQEVSLSRAAAALVRQRPDLPEVAARVRTRRDVDWMTFGAE
jgi:hypothetical protein